MRSSGSAYGLSLADRAETLMGDEKAAFDIKRQTIRAAGAAMRMREDADLGGEAALVQRHAPDLVRPRHGYQEGGLLQIDNDAVRTGDRVEEAGQGMAVQRSSWRSILNVNPFDSRRGQNLGKLIRVVVRASRRARWALLSMR
jgi:hypothetical protein